MTMFDYEFGRVADLSTGHLAISVREMLDRVQLGTSTTLVARTGYGYLMRPLKDQPVPEGLPLEVALVLDHASLQGFDMIHFDRDGNRDPSLPWFEDGDVALNEPAMVKFMGELLFGLRSLEEDPVKRVLLHMATLAMRKIELDGHEPPRDLLIELRDAAVEFIYSNAPDERFEHAVGSVLSWLPDAGPELEI